MIAGAGRSALTFGTAWEILDVRFFRETVGWFSELVEQSLGAYRAQWGDHLVRAYQVLLHAPLSRVRCFDRTEFADLYFSLGGWDS